MGHGNARALVGVDAGAGARAGEGEREVEMDGDGERASAHLRILPLAPQEHSTPAPYGKHTATPRDIVVVSEDMAIVFLSRVKWWVEVFFLHLWHSFGFDFTHSLVINCLSQG